MAGTTGEGEQHPAREALQDRTSYQGHWAPLSTEPRILQARVWVKADLPGPSGTPEVCAAPAPPTTPDPAPTNSASGSPAPRGCTRGTLGPGSFSLKSGPERPQSDCSPGSLLLCPCGVACSGHFVTGTPQHVVLSFGVMFSRALELQASFMPGDVVVMHMLPGWRARLLPSSIELLGTPVFRAWWICTSISLGATAGLQPAPCPGDTAAEAAAACFDPTIGNKDSKLPPSLATLVFLVIVLPWASRCGCDSFP